MVVPRARECWTARRHGAGRPYSNERFAALIRPRTGLLPKVERDRRFGALATHAPGATDQRADTDRERLNAQWRYRQRRRNSVNYSL
jgi:hypothetical protein